jgi:hypothetical protein
MYIKNKKSISQETVDDQLETLQEISEIINRSIQNWNYRQVDEAIMLKLAELLALSRYLSGAVSVKPEYRFDSKDLHKNTFLAWLTLSEPVTPEVDIFKVYSEKTNKIISILIDIERYKEVKRCQSEQLLEPHSQNNNFEVESIIHQINDSANLLYL